MKKKQLTNYLDKTIRRLSLNNLNCVTQYQGKVRDIIDFGKQMIICTTDRISAFDRVLTTIPCKGQVLHQLSLFWFNKTKHIIKNHVIQELSPHSVLVKKSSVIPVEVVVRGYLSGSAWRDYQNGKSISGITLPPGMKFNQKFEKPIITPSTKAERGTHDQPISCTEIVRIGIVQKNIWKSIEQAAFNLFQAGTEIAAQNGLILVDTKYEFGLINGQLFLIDEIHTPDSSRYWYIDTYQELFENGQKQRKLDKEYFRQWLMERGYMGDGEQPSIPDEVRIEVAWRYIKAFETITGNEFIPTELDGESETKLIMEKLKK